MGLKGVEAEKLRLKSTEVKARRQDSAAAEVGEAEICGSCDI